MTGLGNASMLYTNTTLDAYGVFNSACWSASDTYCNGMYGASSAYSSSMRSANYMYARAGFEADKSHTLAIFSAAKTEALANADADYTIAKSNAAASKTASDSASSAIDTLFSHLGNVGNTGYDFNNWLSEASTTSATLTAFNSTETAARNQRISNGNTQLGNLKSQNALTRKNTDAISDLVWHGAMETNSTNYMMMAFSAATTYMTAATGLGATYANSLNTAYDTYVTTEANAWNKYVKQANRLDQAYSSAIAQLIANPNFDAAGHVQQVVTSQSNGGTGSEVQPFAGGATSGSNEDGGDDFHTKHPYAAFWASFCIMSKAKRAELIVGKGTDFALHNMGLNKIPGVGSTVSYLKDMFFGARPCPISKAYLGGGIPSIVLAPDPFYKEKFEAGDPNFTTSNYEVMTWYGDSLTNFTLMITPGVTVAPETKLPGVYSEGRTVFGVANSAESSIASRVSKASRFLSKDKHVTETAMAIEDAYPGKVLDVNKKIFFPSGNGLVTEFDIILDDAVIQVKSGNAQKLIGQVGIKTEDGLRVSGWENHRIFGYAPDRSDNYVRIQQLQGLSITNSIDELLRWIGGK